MFYAGAPKEDLEAILAALTEEMGEDYVKLIMAKNPPNSIKRQVDWLHLMCCTRDHDNEYGCEYYQEEMLDNGWSQYQHRTWMDFWKDITRTCEQERLQRLIYTTGRLTREIMLACNREPDLEGFLELLALKNPRFLVPATPQKAPVPVELSEAADVETGSVLSPEG